MTVQSSLARSDKRFQKASGHNANRRTLRLARFFHGSLFTVGKPTGLSYVRRAAGSDFCFGGAASSLSAEISMTAPPMMPST